MDAQLLNEHWTTTQLTMARDTAVQAAKDITGAMKAVKLSKKQQVQLVKVQALQASDSEAAMGAATVSSTAPAQEPAHPCGRLKRSCTLVPQSIHGNSSDESSSDESSSDESSGDEA